MPFRRETWHSDFARWLYIIVVIASAASMAILFVLINNDRHSISREATIRATQIQQQRYDATYRNCVETNQRHSKTIKQLKKNLRDYVKSHPATKAQVNASLKSTILLIDALAPKRNCKVVAKLAVHSLANPNGR